MEARIPFAGFYETLWSNEVDSAQELIAQNLSEEHGISEAAINELIWRHAKFNRAFQQIAAAYVPAFNAWLNDYCMVDVTLRYVEMTSPREYNFETDKIFVSISVEDSYRLYRKAGKKAVREMAKRMFTSRDGFISHYRADIDEWGPLRSWDHNQLYYLFHALIGKDNDCDYEIYEDLHDTIYSATSDCIDWNELMLEIGKMVALKELEEESEDGKFFPTTNDPNVYIQQYISKNGLIP